MGVDGISPTSLTNPRQIYRASHSEAQGGCRPDVTSQMARIKKRCVDVLASLVPDYHDLRQLC